jgi:hypothetical protein
LRRDPRSAPPFDPLRSTARKSESPGSRPPSSSSFVVAPSYKPPMVLVATRSASTCPRPAQQRPTARTILLTSTGSSAPLRLRTRMVVGTCGCRDSVAVPSVWAAASTSFPPRYTSVLSGKEWAGKKGAPAGGFSQAPSSPLGDLGISRTRLVRPVGRSSDSQARGREKRPPPTGRRFPVSLRPVLDDGFRSCSPLRGSLGLSPSSLFNAGGYVRRRADSGTQYRVDAA